MVRFVENVGRGTQRVLLIAGVVGIASQIVLISLGIEGEKKFQEIKRLFQQELNIFKYFFIDGIDRKV